MDMLLFAYAFVMLLLTLFYVQPASNSFNFISFQANSVPVFDIRGSGQSIWHQGGITIETGGLRVLKGGKLFDLKDVVFVVFRSSLVDRGSTAVDVVLPSCGLIGATRAYST